MAAKTEARLRDEGHTVWRASAWSGEEIAPRLRGVDLLITYGGDGTVLRMARMSAPLEVPVLSVNFGRLGFLTEVEPADFAASLDAYFAGNYRKECRILLDARVLPRSGRPDAEVAEYYHRRFSAMNDIVVSRGGAARVIRLRIMIDDAPYTTYIADGAIVATPTGSTAYALAAGGPILDPAMDSILLTPIAPHLGLQHSLVLPGDSKVTIETRAEQDCYMSVDGQHDLRLEEGDVVEIVRSRDHATLIRMHPPTAFYGTLSDRLTRRLLDGKD